MSTDQCDDQMETTVPVAVCRVNWQVLFENGEVYPVYNFVDDKGRMLPDHVGSTGMLFRGPNDKWFFCKHDDDVLDVLSLH